jgi:hypothetical protein
VTAPFAYSIAHVVALLKGTIEGDPYKHFGSLLGMDSHIAAAHHFGLIDANGELTEAGRAFYRDAKLSGLPEGRANYWSASAPHVLAGAKWLLERRLSDEAVR